MVAYLRQFLVMFLVILQFAAPLVHAHIGHSAEPGGLHLSEFEALHFSDDEAVFTAADHDLQVQSTVVNLGSAIKQQQLLERHTPIFYLIINPALDFAVTYRIAVVNFSPHVPPFLPELSPSHYTSRAPPI